MSATTVEYPQWICAPCGKKYGRGFPKGHAATWHSDNCGICGTRTMVTEPRDFGHLKPGWRELGAQSPQGGEGR